jgi:hypothetical protein
VTGVQTCALPISSLNFFNKSLLYPNYLSLINDDSDKKKINFPIYKIFNTKLNKNNFYNSNSLNKLNEINDLYLFDNNSETKNNFFNEQISYKTSTAFSPNQTVALSERYIRNSVKNSPALPHYNHNLNLNSLNDYISISNNNLSFNNYNFLNFSNGN